MRATSAVEPAERRADPGALQISPVGNHQAPRFPCRASIARTASTSPARGHLDLRRLRLPVLVGLDLGRQPRPEREILQLHHPARPLVAALDHRDRAAPLVGILQLPRHVAAAEEHLGAQPAGAQLRRHRLVAGHLGPDPSP